MSIVISGASGQLGRRVTELLLDRVDPSELVLVSRSPDKLADAAQRGAQVRKGDFDDPAGLAEAFRGGERLLLISSDLDSSRVPQHRNAIEAAKAAGVQFVAYTSFAEPTEHNPAAVSADHLETERMLRESGMAWAFLRNSYYAEMQLAGAQAALASGSLVHNAGAGRTAYVSKDDCAAVAATVVCGGDHAGNIYDVTGPQALGADELASLYSEVGGRNVAPVAVDDAALVEGLVESGLPAEVAELVASFGAAAREGHMDTVSSSVEDLTGRPPQTFREVLEEHREELAEAAGSVPAVSQEEMNRRSFLGGAGALAAAAAVPAVGIANPSAAEGAEPPRAPRSRGRGDRKVVLITGTSSGFGRLTALTLARKGYEVHASMRHLRHRNAAAGRELELLGRREGLALEVVEIDVRSERSVHSGVQQVLRRAGRLDVLVNNAGIFYPALLETQTTGQVQQIFETNVFGGLRMNRAVLPTMRDQGDGLVVQMTSGVGRIAFPFQGAYNGAKWAMEALAQVSRYELSQSGVDVVIVEPGAYPTDLIDNARVYYRRYRRRLTRADARRRDEYGDLASRVENELQEPPEPDPQDVADAIARLVQTPSGQRPLRTLVGEDVELLGEINAVHQRIQDEIMGLAGYGDLISVQPQARRPG